MAALVEACTISRLLARTNTSRISLHRNFSTSRRLNADFTHAVIGGGVVGLAIARQLASKEGTSTILIERHGAVGTETSSRNSEVIHAGIYYGLDSFKTKLCIKGKQMLYDLCSKQGIPHRNTKKWVLAQDEQQMGELEKVHKLASALGVPTHFLTRNEITEREPDVRAEAGVLESPTSGIVDSHSLMTYLEGDFQELGGEAILHTEVTHVEPISNGSGGYRLHTRSSSSSSSSPSSSEDSLTVETLINSAGLSAIDLSNKILPPSRHRKAFFAKGNYFSYASSHPKPKTLLYPAPVPGHGGLGTHLTLDMAGRVRFGPDVEWVDDPTDLTPNPGRLADAIEAIRAYLPAVDADAIDLDYCGIRPKLGRSSGTAGPTFEDFYIKKEDGFEGFVNLLGIESPGLTSSLAIAELVEELLYGSKTG